MKNAKFKIEKGIRVAAASLAAFFCAASSASAADGFAVVALLDTLDFAKAYDIETAKGVAEVVDHVQRTHPTEIWWRDQGGGRVRYPSECELWQYSEAPFDKRRLPAEDVYGRLRLESARLDEPGLYRAECERRGLVFGIHTTVEENHWYHPLSSNWTLAHPEFWGCTRDGEPWMGCCSIMWPQVVRHKLARVDERLALKPKRIMLDFWRNGSWSFAREYTQPALAEWKRLYGDEPVPDEFDPRWRKMVGARFCDYLRRFGAKCRAAGVEFVGGFMGVDDRDDASLRARFSGVEWRPLAKEGVFDAVYILGITMDPKDPFGSTERIYRSVMSGRGKAEIYFPVASYNFEKCGLEEYSKLTGLSEAEVARRLVRLARAQGEGVRGIVLECVDYGNYSPAVCDAIAEILNETNLRQ